MSGMSGANVVFLDVHRVSLQPTPFYLGAKFPQTRDAVALARSLGLSENWIDLAVERACLKAIASIARRHSLCVGWVSISLGYSFHAVDHRTRGPANSVLTKAR
jgi:hypothetical protein